MITSTLALLLATAGPASAGPAPSPSAVTISTAAKAAVGISTLTVANIYTGDRVRDPFLPAAMGSSRPRPPVDAKVEGPEVVDIHGMALRGIMKDARVDYALFASENGGTYLLRGGKLYNERNKAVPHITGVIKLKQKTVELMAPGGDVQPFRLGEDEKEKDKP